MWTKQEYANDKNTQNNEKMRVFLNRGLTTGRGKKWDKKEASNVTAKVVTSVLILSVSLVALCYLPVRTQMIFNGGSFGRGGHWVHWATTATFATTATDISYCSGIPYNEGWGKSENSQRELNEIAFPLDAGFII